MWMYDNNDSYIGFTYNGVEYYYVYNLQGDVVAITDSTGTIVAKYEYDTWGEVQYEANYNGTVNIAVINPIRYRGYYYDSERGLYYLNSRYYDPFMCRFLNADGYVTTGQGVTSFNMFAYCLNNPVNIYDPNGCFGIAIGIGKIIAAAVAFVVVAVLVYVAIEAITQNPPSLPTIALPTIPWPSTEEKDDTDVKEKDITIPPPEHKIFPVNPDNFNPIGLIKYSRNGTKNGRIINWIDPVTNKEVFRWDENINYSNGPHYHVVGFEEHFIPGVDSVPEPYATIYFSVN